MTKPTDRPSRELVATFTHPQADEYLFLDLVESVMQDVSERGIENLPMNQDPDGLVTSTYRSRNGVTARFRASRRGAPKEDPIMPPVITTTMRQWKTSKAVRAEKILDIEVGHRVVTLHFAPNADGFPHTAYVSHQWNVKHHPSVGGYLVGFDDGFHTFIAATTFEAHYHLREPENA